MPNCTNCMSFISLQLVFPKVALILKTFTFEPYCYPYAPHRAKFLTRFSTPNLRLTRHSNTLASKFHVVGPVSGQIYQPLVGWPPCAVVFTRTSKSPPAESWMLSVPAAPGPRC